MISEGRLVNLAAGQGHPVEIMDMSFSIQALCAEHLAKKGADMEPRVYDVPHDIDEGVARLALGAMDVEIDALSAEQKSYLKSWTEGT